jgi:hypothetical protein
MLFPTYIDSKEGITVDNFNYTPVVLSLFFIISAAFWNMPRPYGAKHAFRGPLRPDLNEDNELEGVKRNLNMNYNTME